MISGDKILFQDIISVMWTDDEDIEKVEGFRIYQADERKDIITFNEIVRMAEEIRKKPVTCLMVIAEYPLRGEVYRYNNYGKQEWVKVGDTHGYA